MSIKAFLSASVVACAMSAVGVAQGPPPPQQNYPPQQQNYPPPQQQGYPPQQGYPAQRLSSATPPRMAPQQLDQLVGRVRALSRSSSGAGSHGRTTYSNEIAASPPPGLLNIAICAAVRLSRAMNEDNLQFDPSVMALLPFPSVLDMMARDPGWTQCAAGDAVLGQRPDVMDAVQRMRDKAMESGYLETNSQDRVVDNGPGDIEILPINAGYVYVPFLRSAGGVRSAPSRLLHWGRHYVWPRHIRRGVRAIWMGWPRAGMAYARHFLRSSRVGTELGESRQLCASVRLPGGACGGSTGGAACGEAGTAARTALSHLTRHISAQSESGGRCRTPWK